MFATNIVTAVDVMKTIEKPLSLGVHMSNNLDEILSLTKEITYQDGDDFDITVTEYGEELSKTKDIEFLWIARNTSSESARISTIPGSNTIGIELPNNSRENVYLSEILNNSDFKKKDIKLPIALGKSISGNPIVGDLSSMPHLLIAGTTGSGKSVCINTIILSILYRHTPDKCKFILIDPKMLELSTYEGIPHLLCPVITEAKRAASVLGWVVKEMENRYKLMTKEGVRNIEG